MGWVRTGREELREVCGKISIGNKRKETGQGKGREERVKGRMGMRIRQ